MAWWKSRWPHVYCHSSCVRLVARVGLPLVRCGLVAGTRTVVRDEKRKGASGSRGGGGGVGGAMGLAPVLSGRRLRRQRVAPPVQSGRRPRWRTRAADGCSHVGAARRRLPLYAAAWLAGAVYVVCQTALPAAAWLSKCDQQVAVGERHTCVVGTNNQTACDGANEVGQTAAPGNVTFAKVAAAGNYTCGSMKNGSSVCWGDVPGATTGHPAALLDGDGAPLLFTKLAPGATHWCGILVDGSLACGSDGTAATAPPAGAGFADICSGTGYSCAIVAGSSRIQCWGDAAAAVAVPRTSNALSLACGTSHACVVQGNFTLLCWGAPGPHLATGAASVFRVAAGSLSTCALLYPAAAVRCWGNYVDRGVPLNTTSFNDIVCGPAHCCSSAAASSRVWCWPTVLTRVDRAALGSTYWVEWIVGTGAYGGTNAAPVSGTAATLYAPRGMAITTNGTLYFADYSNGVVRRYFESSKTVDTWYASIPAPWGVALNAAQNTLYVSATTAYTIYSVSMSTGTASVIAGSNLGRVDGVGANARFRNLAHLAVDASGGLYVADYGNHALRILTPKPWTVSTYAGTGAAGTAESTTLTTAQFSAAKGIALVDNNNAGTIVFVADSSNHRVRRLVVAGGSSTVAGSGTAALVDGIGTAARFNLPFAVVVESVTSTGGTTLLVADTGNNALRRVTEAGVVTTVSRWGSVAATPTSGPSTSVGWSSPGGLTINDVGEVYVSEMSTHVIRRLSPMLASAVRTCGVPTPSATPSISHSRSPSSTRTPASTISATRSPLRTPTGTRTATTTASMSSSLTRTPTASHSPSSSRTYSPTQTVPPCSIRGVVPDAACHPACFGLLVACRAFQVLPDLRLTSDPPLPSSLVPQWSNATYIQVACAAEVGLWGALLLSLRVGNDTTMAIKPRFALPSALGVVGSGTTSAGSIALAYAADLVFTAPLLALGGLSAVQLQPVDPRGAPAVVTCAGRDLRTAPSDTATVRCRFVRVPAAAFRAPLSLTLQWSTAYGDAAQMPLPGVVTVVLLPPTLTLASAAQRLWGGGPDASPLRMTLSTPVRRSAAGADDDGSGRAWVVPMASGGEATAWRSSADNVTQCAAPPDSSAAAAVAAARGGLALTVTLGRAPAAMSATSPVLSHYIAPVIAAVAPAVFPAPATPCSGGNASSWCLPPQASIADPAIQVRGYGLYVPDTQTLRLANVQLAGIACAALAPVTMTAGGNTQQAVDCSGWPGGALPADVAGDATSAPVPVSWEWAGAVGGGSCSGSAADHPCMTADVRPALHAVLPPFVAAGVRITVAATGLTAGGMAPLITIGGEVCANASVAERNVATCTAPALSPLTPGFPAVSVQVANGAGTPAVATATVSFRSPLAMAWEGAPLDGASTILLPSGRRAGGLPQWVPPPRVVVTGVGAGTCWLETGPPASVTAPLPPDGWASSAALMEGVAPAAPALVGATSLRVSVNASALQQTLVFDGVGLYGGDGAAVNMTAACVTAAGEGSVLLQPWPLRLATLIARWQPRAGDALASPLPPSTVLSLGLTVAWLGVPPPSHIAAPRVPLTCTATILDAAGAGGDSMQPRATAAGAAIAACDLGTVDAAAATGAANSTCWQIHFADLPLAAARLPLNAPLGVTAACTWEPTGQVVSPPVLRGVVASWQPALAARAAASPLLAGVRVFMSTPVPLAATVNSSARAQDWAAANVTCALATVASTGAHLGAAAASATYTLDGAAGALTPPVVVEVEGTPGASVAVALACTAWGATAASAPLTIAISRLVLVRDAAAPTLKYYPSASTTGTAFPLLPRPSFAVVDDGGTAIPGVTCKLATTSPGATLAVQGASSSRGDPTVTSDVNGTLSFDGVLVLTTFAVAAVDVTLSCQRDTADAPEPYTWTLTPYALTATLCVPPLAVTDDSAVLPPWSIGIRAPGVPVCSNAGSFPPAPAPALSCAVTPGAADDGEVAALVVHGTAAGADASGVLTFPDLQVVGRHGGVYTLTVACALGDVPIPPTVAFQVEVRRCPAGRAPNGLYCAPCPPHTYTRGANEQFCLPCPPAGAVCDGGVLRLQPHFYRQAGDVGPITPATPLFQCFNSEACTFNATAEAYACAAGYTGALCGVCDARAGYGMFGSACRPCWPAAPTWTLLAALVTAGIATLALVSLSAAMQAHDDSAVALKILIGYVQAVSSLRVFAAGGVPLFMDALGWSDYVSASPFSLGAIQCQLQWNLLARYLATVSLPVTATGAAAAIVAAAYTRRACRWSPRPTFSTTRWRGDMRLWVARRRPHATLAFMAFFAYMPIVTASFRILDCLPAPVDGEYWLRSDYAVACYGGVHATAIVAAIVVLVLVGAGMPAGIVYLLARAGPDRLHDPHFQGAFSFLYEGYCRVDEVATRHPLVAPPSLLSRASMALSSWGAKPQGATRSLVWWEAVILLRKAATVMLATVVARPFYQVVGATLLFAACIAVQQHYNPYVRARFNALELGSLVALYITSAVSTVMLPATAGLGTGAGGDASAARALTNDAWTFWLTLGLVVLVVVALGVLVAATAAEMVWTATRTARAVDWRRARASIASIRSRARSVFVSPAALGSALTAPAGAGVHGAVAVRVWPPALARDGSAPCAPESTSNGTAAGGSRGVEPTVVPPVLPPSSPTLRSASGFLLPLDDVAATPPPPGGSGALRRWVTSDELMGEAGGADRAVSPFAIAGAGRPPSIRGPIAPRRPPAAPHLNIT